MQQVARHHCPLALILSSSSVVERSVSVLVPHRNVMASALRGHRRVGARTGCITIMWGSGTSCKCWGAPLDHSITWQCVYRQQWARCLGSTRVGAHPWRRRTSLILQCQSQYHIINTLVCAPVLCDCRVLTLLRTPVKLQRYFGQSILATLDISVGYASTCPSPFALFFCSK
jgi:hypothetical protein